MADQNPKFSMCKALYINDMGFFACAFYLRTMVYCILQVVKEESSTSFLAIRMAKDKVDDY